MSNVYFVNYSAATGNPIELSIDNFSLQEGAVVVIKFAQDITTIRPMLNINDTGAKAIYNRNSRVNGKKLKANYVYMFVYDGTRFELVGDLNTDTWMANAVGVNGYVAATLPTKEYEDKVWATDSNGNPGWREVSEELQWENISNSYGWKVKIAEANDGYYVKLTSSAVDSCDCVISNLNKLSIPSGKNLAGVCLGSSATFTMSNAICYLNNMGATTQLKASGFKPNSTYLFFFSKWLYN